jgi:hypothetical protein
MWPYYDECKDTERNTLASSLNVWISFISLGTVTAYPAMIAINIIGGETV